MQEFITRTSGRLSEATTEYAASSTGYTTYTWYAMPLIPNIMYHSEDSKTSASHTQGTETSTRSAYLRDRSNPTSRKGMQRLWIAPVRGKDNPNARSI